MYRYGIYRLYIFKTNLLNAGPEIHCLPNVMFCYAYACINVTATTVKHA